MGDKQSKEVSERKTLQDLNRSQTSAKGLVSSLPSAISPAHGDVSLKRVASEFPDLPQAKVQQRSVQGGSEDEGDRASAAGQIHAVQEQVGGEDGFPSADELFNGLLNMQMEALGKLLPSLREGQEREQEVVSRTQQVSTDILAYRARLGEVKEKYRTRLNMVSCFLTKSEDQE